MTIRHVILAVEILCLLLFIIPIPIINEGNTAGIAFFGLVIAVTAKFEPFCGLIRRLWGKTPTRVLVIAAAVFLAAGSTYACILSFKMYRAQENAPDDTELIVVLGCQVKGTRPSRMLRRRLDVALTAMEKHPDAVCVVSGGQGYGEKISEAKAMHDYLISKGADESRIIMEDKSTSTFENIKFTFAITDKLGYGRDITIVTDGFHQYRASLIAKQEGAGRITAYSAHTEPRYLFTFWVREWLGLTYFWIFGK